MNLKLIGFVALAATSAFGTSAVATTVAEFDQKSTQDKAEIFAATVHKIREYYISDQSKVQCIEALFSPGANYETSRGTGLFLDEFMKAREDDPTNRHVESIVSQIIERECP